MSQGFQNKIGENPIQYSKYREYDSVTEEEFYEINKNNQFVFIVGFPKTATSTLASILDSHHEITLPDRKEPFFFASDEYNYGMGYYWEKYYSSYNQQKIICDATTGHCFLPYVPKRFFEKLPHEKIIFSMRNPIDRAYSNWWMYKSSGEENLSFEAAIDWELNELEKGLIPYEDDEFWNYYYKRLLTRDFRVRRKTVRTYLTRGYYALHIKRYMRYFSKENILCTYQEDLKKDRQKVISDIVDFLNISNDFEKESVKQNYHVSSNSLFVVNLRNKILPYKGNILGFILKPGQKLAKILDPNVNKTKMKNDTRNILINYYESKNKELSELLGGDFSHWNQ